MLMLSILLPMRNNATISVIQSIGILLVVIGHSFYAYSNDCIIHKWIYSFHMPLFMFISGYLLRYTLAYKGISLKKMSFSDRNRFVLNKFKRLIVPYIVVSTLAFFPKSLMNSFAARPVDVSIVNYFKMLVYPWDNVIVFFWFLPTLFLIFTIVIYGSPLFNKIKNETTAILLILLCTILHLYNPVSNIMLLNISGVCNYILFFVLGFYVCFYSLDVRLKEYKYLIFVISGFLSFLFLYVQNSSLLSVVKLFASFAGILFCVSFAHIYIEKSWRFLNFLFGASFTIYLFSWFPQVLAQQVLCYLLPTIPPWVSTILAIVSGVIVPLYIYKIVIASKKYRIGHFVAFLIGL